MQHPIISVKSISKKFLIPHEKINSLRGAFVKMFSQKTYETFSALDDVSFEIYPGECLGILGKNGSGKSTLLKILSGVYQSDQGFVHLTGKVVPFLELGVGFNPELSGRDNIFLNGMVMGLSRKQIEAKFADIVAFSEMERFIDQKVKRYSSGMYMRLAFAIAIHTEGDILIMDEILAVGDASFQEKCLRHVKKMKDMGKTIILVSHSEDSLLDFSDRVMILNGGKVEKIGVPQEMVDWYRKNML